MIDNCLHITNGSSLTNYLKELGFEDTILTWHEMLCEGPTIPAIDSEEFFKIRIEFLKNTYDVDVDSNALKKELSKLDDITYYECINLWFEYDLFCHINLIGVINLLHQKEINLPIYHICSGRVNNSKSLKGLAELSPEQVQKHYKNKVLLTQDDLNLAIAIWRTYCGKDHNILKPYIVTPSNFKYLSNCLKAHLRRFPTSDNKLNVLEENILKLIKNEKIKSKHHLLGYALNYQGYYGYGDMQLGRIIDELSMFYTINQDGLNLNRAGHEALMGLNTHTINKKHQMVFGGVSKNEFYFNKQENKLVKNSNYEH